MKAVPTPYVSESGVTWYRSQNWNATVLRAVTSKDDS